MKKQTYSPVGLTLMLILIIGSAVLWNSCNTARGAPIPGTVVAAPITTGDTDNTFPTAYTWEITGSMKQVPDVATRNTIPALRRAEGMFCYVTGETNVYALIGGTNNSDWKLWASGTNGSGGSTVVAAGTNIVVTFLAGIYTVSVADPLTLIEADAGTLVVTNPPFLNLANSTNLPGTEVNIRAGTNIAFTTNASLVTIDGPSLISLNVANYVETNIFQTIHVASNFFGIVLVTNSVTAPESFFGTNNVGTQVVTNKLELQYLTPNTVVKADANRDLASIPVGEGALTNRGAGPSQFGAVANNQLQNSSVTFNGTSGQIDTTSASIALGGSATLSMSNPNTANTAWNGSNYVNGVWTFATNSNNTTPDMAVPESLLSTNNNFTFLAPTHVNGGGPVSQWILIHVTNTTAVAKTIAVTAPSTLVGTGYVTNWSDVYVNVYSAHKTNFFVIPCN